MYNGWNKYNELPRTLKYKDDNVLNYKMSTGQEQLESNSFQTIRL